VFRWINSGWGSPFGDSFFRFFSCATQLPAVLAVLAVVLAAHLVAGGSLRRGAALAMVSWPVANALCDIFKSFFEATRPYMELNGVRMIHEYNGTLLFLNSSGTVSAHSANMAAIATVMTLEAKWWGAPWVAVAFFTGISRVYVGAHFPSQVLLGWGVGVVCGLVISRTWRAYRANRGKLKAALVVQPPIQSRTD
jgi:membrane-associated phospholipid phosphatase